jgi:hypothetical protein
MSLWSKFACSITLTHFFDMIGATFATHDTSLATIHFFLVNERTKSKLLLPTDRPLH